MGGRDWGAYVDIDISEQRVRYYDANDQLVWESGCITGNPNTGHDTPTGIYFINNKEQNVQLTGAKDPETGEPEYISYVDYWMSFIGGAVGLHDADWQASSSFNDPTAYTWTGSHGCVNLPPDKAAELFNIVQLNDCVIVHM
ncbi:L,D-transpeptidase [Collinsella ihumii]|uniref:L,D-transpeptidase n=1 Tax=Collinsella ihumii TaxID=1720204 RepID=UPI001E5F33CC|nr:L,D-transpeptidase [Collinsella ihumii]